MAFSSSQPPLYSIRSDKGRRANMEDRHDIRMNFMELPLDPTDLEDVLPKKLNAVVRPSNTLGCHLLMPTLVVREFEHSLQW